MHQRYPLSALAALVASIQERRRSVRLALRNTERFGLVHLYFQQGQLIHVEGHRGAGSPSLADVSSWTQGSIREDDVEELPAMGESPEELERTLHETLQRLLTRGMVKASWPSLPRGASDVPVSTIETPPEYIVPSTPSAPSGTSTPAVPPGVHGLPPLPFTGADVPLTARATAPLPSVAEGASSERLQQSQWQLLVLAAHEVLSRAGQEFGLEVAGGLFWQALAHVGPRKPFLQHVELDPNGWLQLHDEQVFASISRFDVVDAMAELFTEYEKRCIPLVGTARARQLIVEATGPLRTSLAQIGLDITPR